MFDDGEIDASLARIGLAPIDQYLWLQGNIATASLTPGGTFAKRFNNFYRVRRSAVNWQPIFFEYMSELRQLAPNDVPNYSIALRELGHRLPLRDNETARIEASFTSKLLATLDPERPVLDRLVLKRLGLKPPGYTSQNRFNETIAVFQQLEARMRAMLECEAWTAVRDRFDAVLAKKGRDLSKITNMKALDLLLWRLD